MSQLPIATDKSWLDQYGTIDGDVYQHAQRLWPHLECYARRLLGDSNEGHQLLMKACALVTRIATQEPDRIKNTAAYLETTWKHLVAAEADKTKHHEESHAAIARNFAYQDLDPTHKIEQEILLRQIVARMDNWTREVFEYRVLGYTFDEMPNTLGRTGHVIRTGFNKKLKRLIQEVARDSGD